VLSNGNDEIRVSYTLDHKRNGYTRQGFIQVSERENILLMCSRGCTIYALGVE
jgi:hypothetical protein